MFALLLLGCSNYTPPGDGVSKGCVDVATIPHGLARGLGLSSHLEWEDDEASTARREFEVDQWGALGPGNVRRDVLWRDLEPERGTWDLALMDRLFDALDTVDADLMALMAYGNQWASPEYDDGHRPPDDVADFGAFVERIATDYGDEILMYEIWNEPNAGLAFWRPEEDPQGYGELLVEASARIRAVDSDALISFGGVFLPRLLLNTGGFDFVREVHGFVPDLADHIDALSYHPYRYPFSAPEAQTDTQDSLTTTACEARELVAEIGVPDLPLWITEMGWHTAPEAIAVGVSPEDQAALLVRGALVAFSQGVEIFDWYTFRDSGEDPQNQEHMFGLYDYDDDPLDNDEASPKPAAHAFSALSRALADHDTVEDLSEWLGLDENTWALRLTGGTGETHVFWTLEETSELLLPGRGKATHWDLNSTETTIRSRRGAFALGLSSSPVFVHVAGAR